MTAVSPGRTVTIGGKDYTLDCSFATLRTLQERFNMDLVFLIGRIFDLRIDQVAMLVAIGSGGNADQIGQDIIDTMDVLDIRASAPYYLLKTELFAWLNIAVAPKDAKQKKRQEMDDILEKQRSLPSPGPTTSDSPSAPSAGSPASSGEATSGN